jgi:hypothetical protein
VRSGPVRQDLARRGVAGMRRGVRGAEPSLARVCESLGLSRLGSLAKDRPSSASPKEVVRKGRYWLTEAVAHGKRPEFESGIRAISVSPELLFDCEFSEFQQTNGDAALWRVFVDATNGGLTVWSKHIRIYRGWLTGIAWAKLRAAAFERDYSTCQYCGATGVRLDCDHIVPPSRGGGDVLSNLVTARTTCNRSKHERRQLNDNRCPTMPDRFIRESALTSESVAQLSDFAERLFWRLTTVADDFGWFVANPAVIQGRTMPLVNGITPKKIFAALQELENAGAVAPYESEHRFYATFQAGSATRSPALVSPSIQHRRMGESRSTRCR